MKNSPKNTAIKEIKKRVVTVEKAKKEFNKWIDDALSRGGFTEQVIGYWIEVKKELDKIDNV